MRSLKTDSKTKFGRWHTMMIRTVVSFALSDQYISITQSIPAFYDSILLLQNKLQTLRQLKGSSMSPITGITARKQELKKKLILTSVSIMNGIYSYAISVNNQVLAAKMKTSPTALHKKRYLDLGDFIQGNINIVNPIVSQLADYGITPQKINDWQNCCNAFKNCLTETRMSISGRVVTNSTIRKTLLQCMNIIYNQCDGMAVQFMDSSPAFYYGYFASRLLHDRHLSTQLRATVKDETGIPVSNADIYIVGTDRSAPTDSNGYALINAIPFGWHQVIVTTPSGTQNFGRFRFKKGQSLTQHFVITTPVSSPKAKITESVKEE